MKAFYRALQLFALVLPLQASTCGSDDERDDNDDDQPVAEVNSIFTDPALKFTISGAERIGRSLVVDFQMAKATKEVLSNVGFAFGGEYSIPNYYMYPTDDQGDYYPLNYICFGQVMHKDDDKIGSMDGTPRSGHIVIPMFDIENKAHRVSVSKLVYCDNYKFAGIYDMGILRMHNIDITDNRGSLWSPDRTLTFRSSEQWNKVSDVFDDYVISFTVSNNCDEPLNHLELSIGGGASGDSYGLTDSNGKSFYGIFMRQDPEGHEEEVYKHEMRVAGSDWNNGAVEVSIPAYGSVECEVIVRSYDGSGSLNMTIGCQTGERLLADEYAYFIGTSIR